MANDNVQEQQLKEILKSQQINIGEIRIIRDLLRQVTFKLSSSECYSGRDYIQYTR